MPSSRRSRSGRGDGGRVPRGRVPDHRRHADVEFIGEDARVGVVDRDDPVGATGPASLQHREGSPQRTEPLEPARAHVDVAAVVDGAAAVTSAEPVEGGERARPHAVPQVGGSGDVVECARPAHRSQREDRQPVARARPPAGREVARAPAPPRRAADARKQPGLIGRHADDLVPGPGLADRQAGLPARIHRDRVPRLDRRARHPHRPGVVLARRVGEVGDAPHRASPGRRAGVAIDRG